MRMPNQCTERNTSMASATVSDRSPVGERRPGTRPIRLAAAMNSHRVPMKGSSRAAWPGAAPSIAACRASTVAFQRRLQTRGRLHAHAARAEPGQPRQHGHQQPGGQHRGADVERPEVKGEEFEKFRLAHWLQCLRM